MCHAAIASGSPRAWNQMSCDVRPTSYGSISGRRRRGRVSAMAAAAVKVKAVTSAVAPTEIKIHLTMGELLPRRRCRTWQAYVGNPSMLVRNVNQATVAWEAQESLNVVLELVVTRRVKEPPIGERGPFRVP
jgi:hypothetical protein